MQKLTKAQKEHIDKKVEKLIEKNAPLLFDIEGAIADGLKFKAEIDALNKTNADIKSAQKERCMKDFETIQAFLGKYKGLCTLYDDASMEEFRFGFVIGKGCELAHPIYFDYVFLLDCWLDSDNFTMINNAPHPIYYQNDIEIYSNDWDTDWYLNLESVFKNVHVISRVEALLTEYITKIAE